MNLPHFRRAFYVVLICSAVCFGQADIRVNDSIITLAPTYLDGLAVTDAVGSSVAPTIDPMIIGEWKENGKNQYFKYMSNSQMFFGTKSIPYVLQNSGNTLVINSITTYQRIGASTASVVGHWRDDGNGEEVIYRADGRYSSMIDGESVGYFGTYTVANSQISGFEFRNLYNTDAGNLIFHRLNVFSSTSIPYTITNGDQTLTIGTGGTAIVYTRQ